MERAVIKDEKLNEKYIKLKHKTGLTVLLYPMEGYSTSTAIFSTKYGSIDRTFRKNTSLEFTTVPDGIAHYLEHKLFENEDGVDTFELFSKTGASANAYTSFDRTAYYFSCMDNFDESLKILLNFVQKPYFTDETVQKEQGIIGQEIKMYEDDADWRVFFNCLENMYRNVAVNVNIAGTVESISKIDKEVLYECYNTFYNMNNMVLVIAGSFDVDSAIDIIKSEIKDSNPVEVERKVESEPHSVVRSISEISLPVSMPQFCIGYKLNALSGLEMVKAEMIYQLICELLAGEGSEFYKDLYDSGLVAGGNISYEVFCGEGFFSLIFSGESSNPKEVLSKLNYEIERKIKTGFERSEVERVKNALYGYCISCFNSPNSVAKEALNSFIFNYDVYDKLKILEELNVEDINNSLKLINIDNSTLSIVSPLKN